MSQQLFCLITLSIEPAHGSVLVLSHHAIHNASIMALFCDSPNTTYVGQCCDDVAKQELQTAKILKSKLPTATRSESKKHTGMDAIIDPYHPINTNLDLAGESREETVSRSFIFVSKAMVDAEETECSICKVSFQGFTNIQPCPEEIKERPVRLTCGHIFGQLCITEWLCEQSSCAKCRHQVLPFTPAQRQQI